MELAHDLATLALYDIVIFADDSGSMIFEEGGERINDLKLILGRVAEVATLFDEDGKLPACCVWVCAFAIAFVCAATLCDLLALYHAYSKCLLMTVPTTCIGQAWYHSWCKKQDVPILSCICPTSCLTGHPCNHASLHGFRIL